MLTKRHLGLAVFSCLLLMISSLSFLKNSLERASTSEDQYTEIYIINGDNEKSGWFDGPSKSEFLKAVAAYPQHLFISPSLWASFCEHRNGQMKELNQQNIISQEQLSIKESVIYNTADETARFSQDDTPFFSLATLLVFNEDEWEFYDTHAGFYYLRPKHDLQDIGLHIERFSLISKPFAYTATKNMHPCVDKFQALFDLNLWQKIHDKSRKKMICISGHGTSRRHAVSRACGLSIESFTKLMLFFNDALCIDVLGVQSCYWPGARILEALKNHKQFLNFHLITPLDKEEPLRYTTEMPLVWSYEPTSKEVKLQEAQQGELLLTGLHDIAYTYDNGITPELKEKLQQVQVVQVNHGHNLKTSFIDAGYSHPTLI